MLHRPAIMLHIPAIVLHIPAQSIVCLDAGVFLKCHNSGLRDGSTIPLVHSSRSDRFVVFQCGHRGIRHFGSGCHSGMARARSSTCVPDTWGSSYKQLFDMNALDLVLTCTLTVGRADNFLDRDESAGLSCSVASACTFSLSEFPKARL